MNATDTWITNNIDMPAIAFFVILGLFGLILYQAQKASNDFDLKDMLRDQNSKPSAFRLFSFVCLATTTWALMYHGIKTNGVFNEWIFFSYLAVWSGTAVASKAIDAYTRQPPQNPPKDPE